MDYEDGGRGIAVKCVSREVEDAGLKIGPRVFNDVVAQAEVCVVKLLEV